MVLREVIHGKSSLVNYLIVFPNNKANRELYLFSGIRKSLTAGPCKERNYFATS
jgi:hypothetical protein